jgi:hypothetical protein
VPIVFKSGSLVLLEPVGSVQACNGITLHLFLQEIETLLGNNPSRVVTPFVVCKLFEPAFRGAATVEVLVNSFIKTRPFACKRHIRVFQDHEFACHGLDESQDKRTDGAGNEISRLGTSNVSLHNANGRKVQQTSDPFLTKRQNVLLPYTK